MARQYEMLELTYTAPAPEGSLAQVNLTASFQLTGSDANVSADGAALSTDGAALSADDAALSTDDAALSAEGANVQVKGFYAGSDTYKVRFLPEHAGTYSYTVQGVVTDAGTIDVLPAAKGVHGIVRAVDQHFEYEDGTLFHPFGTTVYALAHQDPEVTEQTFASLAKAPFNKIRMCVFPKDYNYNHNDPEHYAFEGTKDHWDVHRPDMAFWDDFEAKLARLYDLGIQVDLILFHPYDRWGLSRLPQADNLVYLDYLTRRLAAMPWIWWSLANEYDLCLEHKSMEDWAEIEACVASCDPYHHLLSNHNIFDIWDPSRPLVTHVSIQTSSLTRIPELYRTYKKPVMVDECKYEGNLPENWGCISGREMTARFWRVIASGAYCTHGETFMNPEEVIWWAKGGRLIGESPARIAFLRSIVEELPGPLSPLSQRMDDILTVTEESLAEQEKALSAQGADAHMPQPMKAMMHAMHSLCRMDMASRLRLMDADHVWHAGYQDQVYLKYYDKCCQCVDTLEMPGDGPYRITVIDTWEMTKEVIAEGAAGTVTITLPGKEAMAVLAEKC